MFFYRRYNAVMVYKVTHIEKGIVMSIQILDSVLNVSAEIYYLIIDNAKKIAFAALLLLVAVLLFNFGYFCVAPALGFDGEAAKVSAEYHALIELTDEDLQKKYQSSK